MTTTSRPKKARKKYDGPTAEEKICAALVELMEAGKNPWRKEWKAGGQGGHRNLITGNAYRGSNPILLEMYQSIKGLLLVFGVVLAKPNRKDGGQSKAQKLLTSSGLNSTNSLMKLNL